MAAEFWLYVSKSVSLRRIYVSESVLLAWFYVSKSVSLRRFYVSESVMIACFYVSKSVAIWTENYQSDFIKTGR